MHVASVLRASDRPLCFVVIIPDMDLSSSLGRAYRVLLPFLRHTIRVDAGAHAYRMGLQHRRTGGGEAYWQPEWPSLLLFFANEPGAKVYTVSDELHKQITDAFDPHAARYDLM